MSKGRGARAVSYTHLDVYKRQSCGRLILIVASQRQRGHNTVSLITRTVQCDWWTEAVPESDAKLKTLYYIEGFGMLIFWLFYG